MTESGGPAPDGRDRAKERLVVLTLSGVLALNYPLLALFNDPGLVFGIPTLYLYLFLVWGGFIGLAAWILEGRGSPRTSEGNHPGNHQRDSNA